ncbi:MAG: hypothetical protein WBF15_21625, partial [Candidatus Sulfotelmatobacter sp.]
MEKKGLPEWLAARVLKLESELHGEISSCHPWARRACLKSLQRESRAKLTKCRSIEGAAPKDSGSGHCLYKPVSPETRFYPCLGQITFLLCKHGAQEDVAAEKLFEMSGVEPSSLRPDSLA